MSKGSKSERNEKLQSGQKGWVIGKSDEVTAFGSWQLPKLAFYLPTEIGRQRPSLPNDYISKKCLLWSWNWYSWFVKDGNTYVYISKEQMRIYNCKICLVNTLRKRNLGLIIMCWLEKKWHILLKALSFIRWVGTQKDCLRNMAWADRDHTRVGDALSARFFCAESSFSISRL